MTFADKTVISLKACKDYWHDMQYAWHGCILSVGKPQKVKSPGIRTLGWENNIKMLWEVEDWTHLVQDKSHRRFLICLVVKRQLGQKP